MSSKNDEDEYDIRLRDQLAIAALPSIIDRVTAKVTSRVWLKDGEPSTDFKSDIKVISIMAYQIADAMREARLKSFS